MLMFHFRKCSVTQHRFARCRKVAVRSRWNSITTNLCPLTSLNRLPKERSSSLHPFLTRAHVKNRLFGGFCILARPHFAKFVLRESLVRNGSSLAGGI